jgi:hypothetical protein
MRSDARRPPLHDLSASRKPRTLTERLRPRGTHMVGAPRASARHTVVGVCLSQPASGMTPPSSARGANEAFFNQESGRSFRGRYLLRGVTFRPGAVGHLFSEADVHKKEGGHSMKSRLGEMKGCYRLEAHLRKPATASLRHAVVQPGQPPSTAGDCRRNTSSTIRSVSGADLSHHSLSKRRT